MFANGYVFPPINYSPPDATVSEYYSNITYQLDELIWGLEILTYEKNSTNNDT